MSEEIIVADEGTMQHIVINQDRSVAVPSLLKKSIVQRDHNIERLTFDCPRYWYGKDISALNIYVNYISVIKKAKNEDPGSSLCENVVIDENDQNMLHFDWIITDNVSEDMGGLIFLVCAKSVDSDGNEDVHWNSHLCKELEVQEGLEASSAIVKRYPDVIESILSKLGKQIELRNSGTAIQYRNAGENIWVDLVQLEDIRGEAAVIIESNFQGSDTTANILEKIGETGDKWYSTDDGVYYMISSNGEWINCGSGENLKKIEDEISELKGDLRELQDIRVGYDGTVYETAGKAVREQILLAMQNESASNSGISSTARNLLITILRSGIYNTEQSTNITALSSALEDSSGGSSSVPAESVAVTGETTVNFDDDIILTATLTPSNTTESVVWVSSDETIATVTGSGLRKVYGTVTGIKRGTVTIRAIAGAVYATYTVTVTENVKLPDGYTPLDYIVSNYKSSFDTGVVATEKTSAEYKVNISTIGAYHLLADNGSYTFPTHSNGGTARSKRGGTDYAYSDYKFTTNTDYTIKAYIDENTINVNGTNINTNTVDGGTEGNGTLIFNNYGSANNPYGTDAKWYYMKIWEDGTLVRWYVPCKDSSGTVGMYDVVGNTFNSSATTSYAFEEE